MTASWIRGDWMETFTGKKFYPFDPKLDDIDIEDIAHALSQINRYGGHTQFPYSVAQHSVLVASKAPADKALRALLHDAAEAYIGDLIRPVKKHESQYAFTALEHTVEMAIAAKFDLPWPIMDDEIKALDNRIIYDEREQVMRKTDNVWSAGAMLPPLGVHIDRWYPAQAEAQFLNDFKEYSKWQTKL